MFKLIIVTSLIFSSYTPSFDALSQTEQPVFKYEKPAQMKELTRASPCYMWLPRAQPQKLTKRTLPHKPQHNPKDIRR